MYELWNKDLKNTSIKAEFPEDDSGIKKFKIQLPKNINEKYVEQYGITFTSDTQHEDYIHIRLTNRDQVTVTHEGYKDRYSNCTGSGYYQAGQYNIEIPIKMFVEKNTLVISKRWRGRWHIFDADFIIEKLAELNFDS